MSVTYPADPTKPYGDRIETPNAELAHEPFIPVYARRGKARGGQARVKTWMILTPVAVLVLGGIGAMLVMGGGDETAAPLSEPAVTAPVLPVIATDAAVAPLTSASMPELVVAEPVVAAPVRETAPLRRPTPARTAPAPARREAARAPSPAASAQIVTPAPTITTGPRSYAPAPAASSTSTLNTAPTQPVTTPAPATPAPAMPAPIIIIDPAG